MTLSESQPSIAIAIVTYPGVQMSAVLGLVDLFAIASRFSAQNGGEMALSVTQVNERDIEANPGSFDAVILPPSLHRLRGQDAKTLQAWLRAQHAHGALMCSVCVGAFWLGYSGLLQGRPVTTHWALEEEFRATFPDVHLDTGRLLIDDNDIVSAGGLMAWLDLGLFMVRRWLGASVVSLTARHMLIDPSGREQRNYRSFSPPLSHGDGAILALQHWLEGHADAHITITALAKRAHLSSRTLLRRFKAATGFTPNVYVQNLRVEKARGLLERTRLPVGEIAWRVGYHDPSAFSRIFLAVTGMCAGNYRKRFGVVA